MFHVKQITEMLASEYERVVLTIKDNTEPYYPLLLPTDKLKLLNDYCALLQEWTKKVDLVSEAEPLLLIQRHFIDSLIAGQLIFSRHKVMHGVLDLGSGAGFPGLVMAIMDRNTKFYLCEPREKRTIFLREAIRRLGLTNVSLLSKRFEEVQVSDCDIDMVVSRALVIDKCLLKKIKSILQGKDGHICLIQGENSSNINELTVNWESSYEIATNITKSIVRSYQCFT